MRARAIPQGQSDSALRFALAWTAAVAFVLLLVREPPQPSLFLPVALAALPFAAAPRQRLVFRLAAAVLLAVFVALSGLGLGGLLFAPGIAALLLSSHRLHTGVKGGPARRVRRRRRL